MNDNEIIKSFAVLGIKPGATMTEVRSAYLHKTSQKQFSTVFINDEDVKNEFKRFHSSYVMIMREFSDSESNDLSLYPPNQMFKLLLNQGIYHFITQNYLRAGEKFQEAYSIDKKNEEVLVYLGLLLLKRKNYYAAEKYFSEVIRVNKENDDAWVFLGDTYAGAKNYKKAITMYQTAKELNPLRTEIAEKIKAISVGSQTKKESFLEKIIKKFIK